MNENEKPLSDFISSPAQWDGTMRFLVLINVLFFIIIVLGILVLITGAAVPVMARFIPWLRDLFAL